MQIFPKLFCYTALILLLPLAGRAQSLSGSVIGEQREPLTGARISIPALERTVASDASGKYSLPNLPQGVYVVEFSFVGYEKVSRTITLSGNDVTEDVQLATSPLELPVVTVTAEPAPANILDSPQPVNVSEGAVLDRNRGQSIMQSVEDLPGVSTFSRGPMNMKPVIRGLTGQRVVVLSNGMRHESQQWDDEQSPEIDVLDAERVEVVRGPGSVLYGSDALGGVINIIPTTPQNLSEQSSTLTGKLTLNGFTNDNQGAGSLALFGTNNDIDYKGQMSVRSSGDIKTPEGSLPNSNTKELNGGGLLGVRKEWGNISGEYSHFGQEFHISPDPDAEPGATPAQKISHERFRFSSLFPLSSIRIEVNGSFQKSKRMEFDDSELLEEHEDSAMIHLELTTLAGEVKLHHAPIGKMFGTIGISVMHQKNETLGLEPLIPGFEQTNTAVFLYEQWKLSEVAISVGLRYDGRTLDVDENDDPGVADQSRSYNAATGTLGAVWHIQEPVSIAVNLGRGWRAPIAEELFINGADEGSIRYKMGDSNLNPEESFNVDASLRLNSSCGNGEVTFFNNRINRFIYLSPTADVDTATGFTKYQQRQANATLSGMEISGEGELLNNLVVRGGFDMVIGKNDETDSWLPMIPAHRVKLGVRLTEPALGDFFSPYFSMGIRSVFDQERIDLFESRTGGYTLIDLGIGGEIAAGSHRVRVDLSVDNLFGRAYFDHLSRYKDFGLNPGRNFAAKLTVPFTIAQ